MAIAHHRGADEAHRAHADRIAERCQLQLQLAFHANHDADVTMLQRSSTHIVKSDSLMEEVLGPHEEAANKLLVEIGWLAAGKTFRDMESAHAEEVLARPADFLAKALVAVV